jgi:hypothetical protein
MASLATSLGSPPSLKLTHDKILFWKELVFHLLRGALTFVPLDVPGVTLAKTLEALDDAVKNLTIPNTVYVA